MNLSINFESGSRAGESMMFRGNCVTIGRDPKCSVALPPEMEPNVSKVHCEIYADKEVWWIQDSSLNGTFLNGRKLVSPTPLREGDALRLGLSGPEFTISYDISAPKQIKVADEPEELDKTMQDLPQRANRGTPARTVAQAQPRQTSTAATATMDEASMPHNAARSAQVYPGNTYGRQNGASTNGGMRAVDTTQNNTYQPPVQPPVPQGIGLMTLQGNIQAATDEVRRELGAKQRSGLFTVGMVAVFLFVIGAMGTGIAYYLNHTATVGLKAPLDAATNAATSAQIAANDLGNKVNSVDQKVNQLGAAHAETDKKVEDVVLKNNALTVTVNGVANDVKAGQDRANRIEAELAIAKQDITNIATPFQKLVEGDNHYYYYNIVVRSADGELAPTQETYIGFALSAKDGLIATDGHTAVILQDIIRGGSIVEVRSALSPFDTYRVEKAIPNQAAFNDNEERKKNPADNLTSKQQFFANVGILKVNLKSKGKVKPGKFGFENNPNDEPLPVFGGQKGLTLANSNEIEKIGSGFPIGMVGIPNFNSNAYDHDIIHQTAPQVFTGTVSNRLGNDGEVTKGAQFGFLQHKVNDGLSGSPVFNSSQHVIGINVRSHHRDQSNYVVNIQELIDFVHQQFGDIKLEVFSDTPASLPIDHPVK